MQRSEGGAVAKRYSITSSTRMSIDSGTSMLSDFAALRLMTQV
jgi:hypothetical protein